MFGLIVVVLFGLYLLLLVWATRAAYRWAKKRGWSKARCWSAAGAGFLLVYLPVFWDFIPTLLVHEYRCRNAGYRESNQLSQWITTNESLLKTLVPYNTPKLIVIGMTKVEKANDRLGNVFEIKPVSAFPVMELRSYVIDIETGQILAEFIDFSRGAVTGKGSWKYWLYSKSCYSDETLNQMNDMRELRKKLRMQ
jgi:hypothetical protein